MRFNCEERIKKERFLTLVDRLFDSDTALAKLKRPTNSPPDCYLLVHELACTGCLAIPFQMRSLRRTRLAHQTANCTILNFSHETFVECCKTSSKLHQGKTAGMLDMFSQLLSFSDSFQPSPRQRRETRAFFRFDLHLYLLYFRSSADRR